MLAYTLKKSGTWAEAGGAVRCCAAWPRPEGQVSPFGSWLESQVSPPWPWPESQVSSLGPLQAQAGPDPARRTIVDSSLYTPTLPGLFSATVYTIDYRVCGNVSGVYINTL